MASSSYTLVDEPDSADESEKSEPEEIGFRWHKMEPSRVTSDVYPVDESYIEDESGEEDPPVGIDPASCH